MVQREALPRVQDRLTLSLEGEVFRGTEAEIISQMVSASRFRCHESPEEYIRGYARRSGIMGIPGIDGSNAGTFIDSLIRAGLAIRTPFA